jgi:two-component system response regulator DegU
MGQPKMTVLIVEDNAGVRRLLRCALAGIATAAWDCSDGTDALEAYTAHRPDIVLMDIRMPGMDGLAATRQILRFHPFAKIVIVTDYDDDALRTAAREAGACGYALKLNLLDLAPLIRSIAGP